MDKFQRNYLLTVQLVDGSIQVIEPPFTIDFHVEKNSLEGGNTAQIKILNLSPKLRSQIRHDATNFGTFRQVVLQVGYGTNLSTIFHGNMQNAYSAREGVDFATHIMAQEGGFLFVNGKAIFTFQKGQSRRDTILTIMEDMKNYGISVGKVGNYEGDLSRGMSIDGSHSENLSEMTGGGFSIQNGSAFCIGDQEHIEGIIDIIDDQTGIIGTPIRESTNVRVEMILEPDIMMLQGIELKSSTGDNVNGFYKVLGISHTGIISEAVCGSATTKVLLSPVIPSDPL